MTFPLISITIPAYKNFDYLKILLESIATQTFKNFEVVITDDSPNDDLKPLIENYISQFKIHYQRNKIPLGSPQNWNEGVKLAKGKWIKIMHDDDWFENNTSLEKFVKQINLHPNVTFFYSAYKNIEHKGKNEIKRNNVIDKLLLKSSILNLFRTNKIGNPSCILFKKTNDIIFEPNLKWVVDFEFYIRYISKYKSFKYISEPLVNVGINDEQITNYCQKFIGVEIPENFFMLNNFGFSILKNVFVYDHFWRLIRRFEIKNIKQITDLVEIKDTGIFGEINIMIFRQIKIKRNYLNNGLISKINMLYYYMSYKI